MSFIKGYKEKSISNAIELQADPSDIWEEITNVMVAKFKFPFILKLIGIPKPLTARVIREGVEGYRVATFDNNAQFKQEILVWNVNKAYRFKFNPTKNFKVVHLMNLSNGPFEIQTGGYELLKKDNATKLVLSSDYKLKGLIGMIMHIPFRLVVFFFQKYLLKGIRNNLTPIKQNKT